VRVEAMMRRSSAIAIVALFAVTSPVRAATRLQEMKRHMKAGQAAFALSDYPRAIEEFKKAYEAKPDARQLYNLGISYMKLYELGGVREDQVQARDYLKRYLALMSTRPWTSDKEKQQMQKMQTLAEKYLAALNAEPVEKASGDSARTSTTPPSSVEANAAQKDVAPPPGPAVREDTKSTAVVTPPPAPPERSSVPTILFLAAGASGVVAVATGIFALRASNDSNDAGLDMRYADANTSASHARTFAIVSDIFTGVAIVALGIGLVLSLVDHSTADPAH
jgi:tetratricopeptide (TPR) repeat protein